MGSLPAEAKIPWIKTPCTYSRELSRVAGCNIYLKLDNLQPSGSFKSRGVGNIMVRALAEAHAKDANENVRFYCSSGGNAGLACANAALTLNRPATIVLPTSSLPLMKRKLLSLGVDVQIRGRNWAEADAYMRNELIANDPSAVYVPPFDHQHVWDGASTIIEELREQLPSDLPVDGIVCCVGGGGLLNGIMQGIEKHWDSWPERKPTVIAVETEGADALNASVKAGKHVTLPGITSIATSLGASRVSERTWRYASESKNFASLLVSDADAAVSCVRFADDARILVEASCGATLAVAYRGDLRENLGKGLSDEEWAQRNVVLEVCGGSGVTLEMLSEYRAKYESLATIKATI